MYFAACEMYERIRVIEKGCCVEYTAYPAVFVIFCWTCELINPVMLMKLLSRDNVVKEYLVLAFIRIQ